MIVMRVLKQSILVHRCKSEASPTLDYHTKCVLKVQTQQYCSRQTNFVFLSVEWQQNRNNTPSNVIGHTQPGYKHTVKVWMAGHRFIQYMCGLFCCPTRLWGINRLSHPSLGEFRHNQSGINMHMCLGSHIVLCDAFWCCAFIVCLLHVAMVFLNVLLLHVEQLTVACTL